VSEHFDAIVVGLGAVGGILAEQLTAGGLRVLALDKGADYTQEDFHVKHDEVRYYLRGALGTRATTDPVTWRATSRDVARVLPWAVGVLGTDEPLSGSPSIGSGGGTLHWGSAAYRFREADFKMRSSIEERFGRDALPEDTTLADWPISYADLEPYYDRTEYEQGVSGEAGNLDGVIQETGNPFEAPRSRPYPMPPVRQNAGDHAFVEACRRLGYHPFRQPVAINSQEYRGRSACVNCGFCHGYPCHVEAKSTTQVTSIPAAKATGLLDLRPYTRVYRVNRGAQDRVTGVSYFDWMGTAREAHAPLVILAAYALENTRLLLVSGINENGHVGRHLMLHNYGFFGSLLPEWTNPFMGSFNAGSAIDDFTSELIPDNEAGVLWGAAVMSLPGDMQPVEAFDYMPQHAPRWGRELKDWLRDNFGRLHRMYAQISNLPSPRHYCDLDPNIRDRFGQPALRITHEWDDHDVRAAEYFRRIKERIAQEMDALDWWHITPLRQPFHVTTHDVGLHRMGEDPAASVTDTFGEVHECPGLFALGGGQFPSYGTYNPTLTLQALAYRTADRLLVSAGISSRRPVAGSSLHGRRVANEISARQTSISTDRE